MKFGQLILEKIVKIVATRCRILRLKCTKINYGRGSELITLRGCKEGEGRKGRGTKKEKGERKEEGEGKEGKGGKGGAMGRLAIPILVCFRRRCLTESLPALCSRVSILAYTMHYLPFVICILLYSLVFCR